MVFCCRVVHIDESVREFYTFKEPFLEYDSKETDFLKHGRVEPIDGLMMHFCTLSNHCGVWQQQAYWLMYEVWLHLQENPNLQLHNGSSSIEIKVHHGPVCFASFYFLRLKILCMTPCVLAMTSSTVQQGK